MKNQDRLSVENRITRVETKIEEMLTNHLPHIEAKVDRIHWILVTTLITLVIGLATKLL